MIGAEWPSRMRTFSGDQDRNPVQGQAAHGSSRGQSEVIGMVLILAITIFGLTFTVALGAGTLDDARQISRSSSAEHAMTQLDSKVSLVALGSSNEHRVTIPHSGSDDQLYVDENAGWMNITIRNESDPDKVDLIVMNQTMGAIIYENGGTSIAYQGGGVWKATTDDTTMISPPEFHFRKSSAGSNPTLTLPLVIVEGEATARERLTIEKNGTTTGKFPVLGDADRTNPVEDGKVNVTVHSEYYRAWGRFFEERTGGEVDYQPHRESVSITMVVDPGNDTVEGGVYSSVSAGGQTLVLDSSFVTDSYNSSVGDYSTSQDENGSIIVSGNVEMDSNSKIEGTLKTGGTIDMQSNTKITGDLYYSSQGTMKGQVDGDEFNDPPEVDVDPVGSLIDTKLSAHSDPADNDNGAVSEISGNQLVDCETNTCDLPPGTYYLNGLNLGDDGDEVLDLQNGGGNITIVVDGKFHMDGNSELNIQDGSAGGGRVEIYVGSTDGTKAFRMDSNSQVTVPGDRSPKLWVYLRPGTGVRFNSNSQFTGVVYKPDTDAQQGDIHLNSNSIVKGGLIGTVNNIDSNAQLHFDESLQNADALTSNNDVTVINFLHVSVRRINVTAS